MYSFQSVKEQQGETGLRSATTRLSPPILQPSQSGDLAPSIARSEPYFNDNPKFVKPCSTFVGIVSSSFESSYKKERKVRLDRTKQIWEALNPGLRLQDRLTKPS